MLVYLQQTSNALFLIVHEMGLQHNAHAGLRSTALSATWAHPGSFNKSVDGSPCWKQKTCNTLKFSQTALSRAAPAARVSSLIKPAKPESPTRPQIHFAVHCQEDSTMSKTTPLRHSFGQRQESGALLHFHRPALHPLGVPIFRSDGIAFSQ